VFNFKVRDLLYQLQHKEICGSWLGWVWTIEYQKRGLPHLHLLVFLRTDHQFLTAGNIDGFISAKLRPADDIVSQEVRGIIETTMVHTHYVAHNGHTLSMQGLDPLSVQTCLKGYPRAFQAETIIHEDGYPTCRRRDAGQSYAVHVVRNGANTTAVIDNRRVMSYSPYLSLRYKAHINVEVCGSVKAVKYIHKDIYMGGDRATFVVDSEHNEIKRYLHGRYIGPTEAIRRLFEFSTHGEEPLVMHLALHLPNHPSIYLAEGEDLTILRQRMDSSLTTQLAYFKYNLAKADGRQYLYHEFPIHYVYVQNEGWKPRTQCMSIGRKYAASPF